MEAPLADSVLRSNSGNSLMRWILFDYNDENVAIDIQIEERAPFGESEIDTALEDAVKIAIPHVVCSKFAVTEFVASVMRWAKLPMDELQKSDFRHESNLRATDYSYRDCLVVEVRRTEIHRSTGDQKHFQITWQNSFDKVSCGFVIDVTGAELFCRGLDIKKSDPGRLR